VNVSEEILSPEQEIPVNNHGSKKYLRTFDVPAATGFGVKLGSN
jgi:hypothetical protein